jgi:hypothetical protein
MLFSSVIVIDVSLLNSSVVEHTKIITPQAGINTKSASSIQILSSKRHVYKKINIFLIQLENILKKDLMVLIVILSQIFVAGY